MTTQHTVIARRRTADAELVQLWSDGAITVGHETQNRVVARGLSRELAFLVADDVSLYLAAEVKGLVKAARRAEQARRDIRARSVVVANRTNLRPIMRCYAPRAGA
jgi:hypothetical protein